MHNTWTEGCGIRATARLCRVTAKTVFRVLVRAGRQARRFHDVKVRDLHIDGIQVDEKRCPILGSRIVATQPPRTEAGQLRLLRRLVVEHKPQPLRRLQTSRWDHICIASQEKLVIAAAFGSHSAGLSEFLIADVRRRINDGLPPALIESDQFGAIALAVEGQWCRRRRRYVYAVVDKIREEYRVVRCIRRIVHGTRAQLEQLRRRIPSLPKRLNTPFIERYHRTDRAMLAFKQRVSQHLAHKVWHYDCGSWLGITYYNFCRGHRTLGGRTPAQAAGVATKRLALRDVLSATLPRPALLPPPQLSDRFSKRAAAEILRSQR